MSKGTSALIVISIVAILAALGWWYWSRGVAHAPASAGEAASSTETPAVTALPTGSATDDASLNADLHTVDGQMNGFASDNASVDGSMSDEPVEQSSL